MDYSQFRSLLTLSFEKNRLKDLSEQQIQQFYAFGEYLLEVNQVTNLTAIRNMPDVITKHFVDSLLVAELIPQNARVLDLGCGAGFPSVPLAIARRDLSIVALDSTAKKIAFVNDAAKRIGLSNLTAVSGRAEDPKVIKELGSFDVVTSRAVAALQILAELCLPYVKLGGAFLPLKAAKADEELLSARNAIAFLGGSEPVSHYTVLVTDTAEEPRCIFEIQKSKTTPKGYPRAYAAILKKPL
jgi:16S rRNA (guanine527-N7)-methyltransferase